MKRLAPLVALALVGCSSSEQRDPHHDALADVDCGVLAAGQTPGVTVECGALPVPADWDDPDAGEIGLHVTHFFPREAREPAIIVLLGGPGDSTDGSVSSLTPDVVDSIGHELIYFDQRGTGRSQPDAACFELAPGQSPDAAAGSLAACRARLEAEGLDLGTLSTFASVRDVDALRSALGYDEVGLFGMSYGTRLALATLRQFPERVSAIALDSVTPPQLLPFEQLAPAVSGAVDSLLSRCESDAACAAAHPNLSSTLDATLAALPIPTGGPTGGPLTPVDFASALITLQGRSADAIDLVPAFIDQAHADVTVAGALSADVEDVVQSAAVAAELPNVAMYYSVTCADNQLATPAAATSALAAVRLGLRPYFEELEAFAFGVCSDWPTRPQPADRFAAVTSNVPALVMSARYDTITPSSWADAAAATLGSSTRVDITRAAHLAVATDATGCALGLVAKFFDAPTAPLDISCAK